MLLNESAEPARVLDPGLGVVDGAWTHDAHEAVVLSADDVGDLAARLLHKVRDRCRDRKLLKHDLCSVKAGGRVRRRVAKVRLALFAESVGAAQEKDSSVPSLTAGDMSGVSLRIRRSSTSSSFCPCSSLSFLFFVADCVDDIVGAWESCLRSGYQTLTYARSMYFVVDASSVVSFPGRSTRERIFLQKGG